MPGDPFADMGALRTLALHDNDLSSLETGVFDALTALRYVGAGESARVGACGECDAATHVLAHPRICGMDMCTYGSMCVGGGHARAWEPTR
jgi:hypothetical protein